VISQRSETDTIITINIPTCAITIRTLGVCQFEFWPGWWLTGSSL